MKRKISFWRKVLIGLKALIVSLLVALVVGLVRLLSLALLLLGMFGLALVAIISIGTIVFSLWMFGALANKWFKWD